MSYSNVALQPFCPYLQLTGHAYKALAYFVVKHCRYSTLSWIFNCSSFFYLEI